MYLYIFRNDNGSSLGRIFGYLDLTRLINRSLFLAPKLGLSGPVGPCKLRQPFQGIHCKTILKKKKSFPFKHKFTNIDSQNHKHKLRFERGHKPKKKKNWRTRSTKALSPISDAYSASLYLKPPRSPMIGCGFVGVMEIFVVRVRVEIGVELELRLEMIANDLR